jgi:hypothetical protein
MSSMRRSVWAAVARTLLAPAPRTSTNPMATASQQRLPGSNTGGVTSGRRVTQPRIRTLQTPTLLQRGWQLSSLVPLSPVPALQYQARPRFPAARQSWLAAYPPYPAPAPAPAPRAAHLPLWLAVRPLHPALLPPLRAARPLS